MLRNNQKQLLIALIIIAVGILTAQILWEKGRVSNTSFVPPRLPTQEETILVGFGRYSLGSENARVTLVEFGDFQCLACAVTNDIVKKLLMDYKKDLRFVYRSYPLSSHEYGRNSAEAAEAAGIFGKFWEMHELLYKNQSEWISAPDYVAAIDIFTSYAGKLGLDTKLFRENLLSGRFTARVREDIEVANQFGVKLTPAFFINGTRYLGPLSYEDMKLAIEESMK